MLRYKQYSRCIIETNQVERLTFALEHYRNAGYTDRAAQDGQGIDELEALRLINSWNSRGLKYIYWL